MARRNKKIHTILAIPYNPYDPKPFQNSFIPQFFEQKKEVMVGKQFWDFLGGKGTYDDLLKIFDEVGKDCNKDLNKLLQKL